MVGMAAARRHQDNGIALSHPRSRALRRPSGCAELRLVPLQLQQSDRARGRQREQQLESVIEIERPQEPQKVRELGRSPRFDALESAFPDPGLVRDLSLSQIQLKPSLRHSLPQFPKRCFVGKKFLKFHFAIFYDLYKIIRFYSPFSTSKSNFKQVANIDD